MLQGTPFQIFRHNLPFYFAYFMSLESQRACGGGRVQGGASEALLCSGDSHIRCGHPGPVSNPDAFKGLHLPVVILKLCRVCTCPAWWRKFARKVPG